MKSGRKGANERGDNYPYWGAKSDIWISLSTAIWKAARSNDGAWHKRRTVYAPVKQAVIISDWFNSGQHTRLERNRGFDSIILSSSISINPHILDFYLVPREECRRQFVNSRRLGRGRSKDRQGSRALDSCNCIYLSIRVADVDGRDFFFLDRFEFWGYFSFFFSLTFFKKHSMEKVWNWQGLSNLFFFFVRILNYCDDFLLDIFIGFFRVGWRIILGYKIL